jgi:hypothetical protein
MHRFTLPRAQMDALVNTIDTEFELQVAVPPAARIVEPGKGLAHPRCVPAGVSPHRHTAVTVRASS